MRLTALAAAALLALPAAAEPLVSHGLSAFGELKYGPDFEHFDYVNPDAPKGGSMTTTPVFFPIVTFDSLNPFIVSGEPAQGLLSPQQLLYDSLMVRAWDEPDAVYGLVARHAELMPGEWVIFEMRPEATFADGSPVTAEDVVFSFEGIKTHGRPIFQQLVADVVSAEALGPHRVQFTFDPEGSTRDLPMAVAALPILSKAWHQGEDRDISEPYIDPPLGSGPYEIFDVVPGRSITYRRREDYWAADLPVNVGKFNFDEISYRYYADAEAARLALFTGEVDLREEFTSKDWATAYESANAVENGDIIRAALPDDTPSGTQGFWINTRRAKFADRRVREALGLAFDFEWSNDRLFYNLYHRTDSFFEGAPFEASGEPSEAELALLEPLRDQLHPEVFGPAYVPPVSDGSGSDRRLLREASRLLTEAGWELKDGIRVNAEGEQLKVEFLDRTNSGWTRIISPYIENLRLLGIEANLRAVDPTQYQRRRDEFDFDVVGGRFSMALTPGPELRGLYGSQTADREGSYNMAGVADPAVDALLDAAMAAETREEMQIALRAVDRVLRSGRYWVPHWSKGSHTLAWWNKYGRPEMEAPYERAILERWWYDPAKAAELSENQD